MLIKKSKIPVKQIATIGLLPSPLKKLFYRLKGYKIGKSVSFSLGSVIQGKEVEIGDHSKFGFLSVVRGRTIKIGRFVKIGSVTMIDTEKIEIDDDARINEQVIIGGIKNPDSAIKIGKRTIIMEYSFINPTKPVEIGDDTGIGGHCLLFTHGSWLSELDGFPVTFAPIKLGKNVWLPWRVFIMPGVTVGDNVVIGADSLVTKNLPANCLAAGSPAQVRKENYPPQRTEEEKEAIIEKITTGFSEFVTYHGIEVKKRSTDYGFNFILLKDGRMHEIYYLKKSETFNEKKFKNGLVILNYPNAPISSIVPDKFPMAVDLQRKLRIGSSDVGEEFVNYISRHGIRFDRMD